MIFKPELRSSIVQDERFKRSFKLSSLQGCPNAPKEEASKGNQSLITF